MSGTFSTGFRWGCFSLVHTNLASSDDSLMVNNNDNRFLNVFILVCLQCNVFDTEDEKSKYLLFIKAPQQHNLITVGNKSGCVGGGGEIAECIKTF